MGLKILKGQRLVLLGWRAQVAKRGGDQMFF